MAMAWGEAMQTPADAIANYIHAKDGNRPHLLDGAFTGTAVLNVLVKSGTLTFPAQSSGREAIAEVLVRRVGQTFENVYTLCLATPPTGRARAFACDWLVGMSEKASGVVRVGCGRYEWQFQDAEPCLAEALRITIEHMEVLPATMLEPVMQWLSSLPYPWCPARAAARSAPTELAQLDQITAYLNR